MIQWTWRPQPDLVAETGMEFQLAEQEPWNQASPKKAMFLVYEMVG
jgi:hypothetical protein